MLLGSSGLILAGCGGRQDIQAIPPDMRGLKELGELYVANARKNRRGPRSLKELKVPGQTYPQAVEMIKSGELIVQWGAPLSAEGASADNLLAYIKSEPDHGGNVLMQDGKTIKTMTADEFKAAPKAAGR